MAMSQAQQDEQAQQYSRLIATAWLDGDFKQRLIADPATVLAAEGLATPPGAEIRVLENSAEVTYLVLPVRPASDEVSDAELEQVAGGYVGLAEYHRAMS
jgi:hypothetical protein